LFEQDGIASVKVGGNNHSRHGQILELPRIKETMDQGTETVVAGQAEAGHAPAAEVSKANLTAFFNDTGQRKPTGISGTQDAPNTAASDASDGDLLILENAEDSQVGVAPSETASQCQANSWAEVCLVCKNDGGVGAKSHETEVLRKKERRRWDVRPEKAVQRYRRKGRRIKGAGKLGSTEILGKYPRCTIVTHLTPREPSTRNKQLPCPEGENMQSGFEVWLGQAVVLKVELGDIQVPLRGKLLKENSETVRMRIGEGWDVDIYKAMIRGVEEDGMALIPA
jgi:hypothetical protein